jgi:hypothetical protein
MPADQLVRAFFRLKIETIFFCASGLPLFGAFYDVGILIFQKSALRSRDINFFIIFETFIKKTEVGDMLKKMR